MSQEILIGESMSEVESLSQAHSQRVDALTPKRGPARKAVFVALSLRVLSLPFPCFRFVLSVAR